jgi:phosphate transport system permease protein
MRKSLKQWVAAGDPWIWLNAGAISICLIAVAGLLVLIAARGLGHYWPAPIVAFDYTEDDGTVAPVLGEVPDEESVPRSVLPAGDVRVAQDVLVVERYLIKTGNRELYGIDFLWVIEPAMANVHYPEDAVALERREWGNFYGYLVAIKDKGVARTVNGDLWPEFLAAVAQSNATFDEIRHIEKDLIGAINYGIERLRLDSRRLELEGIRDEAAVANIETRRSQLQDEYHALGERLARLYEALDAVSFQFRTADGREVDLPAGRIVRGYRPNSMSWPQKAGFYATKFWEFMADEPREANMEGGIFPAIFGTVMMVILMAMLATPFGVVAAVYLREYAKQGTFTRLVRISVNNLAGVPSIVYGVFGLGFFVYFLGSNIDRWFFPEALPAPTFGTPGLIWASLTLALLTVPVVIVSTEEGLSRVPRAIREGSLALGATKAETLWRTVLPMTASAMMTGMILAIARAAGEVAPLMLVGVVKLAPSLPLDGNFPYLHLERKFMHLGFHIYDVGFQSPNVEAARPLVFATSLLLVVIIVLLNLTAIRIRNRLREKYRAAEQN